MTTVTKLSPGLKIVRDLLREDEVVEINGGELVTTTYHLIDGEKIILSCKDKFEMFDTLCENNVFKLTQNQNIMATHAMFEAVLAGESPLRRFRVQPCRPEQSIDKLVKDFHMLVLSPRVTTDDGIEGEE